MRVFASLLLSGLLLAACANVEGDAVGECSDGADNDRDGRYDCQDPDCFASPSCAGDDDDVTADDDDATSDDDDATSDDDDDATSDDDDDTSPGDDDDTSGAIDVVGTASFVVVTEDLPMFEEIECEGEAAGVLDLGQGTLAGQGECEAEVDWVTIKVPFDFDCVVAQQAVFGLGNLYTYNPTWGYIDDVQMDIAGTYAGPVWSASLDTQDTGAQADVQVTGTILLGEATP